MKSKSVSKCLGCTEGVYRLEWLPQHLSSEPDIEDVVHIGFLGVDWLRCLLVH